MKLVPIPCNYVADGLEANNLLLVKIGSKHRDVHSLIPTEELGNPDAQYPRRTERRTRKVMRLGSVKSAVIATYAAVIHLLSLQGWQLTKLTILGVQPCISPRI